MFGIKKKETPVKQWKKTVVTKTYTEELNQKEFYSQTSDTNKGPSCHQEFQKYCTISTTTDKSGKPNTTKTIVKEERTVTYNQKQPNIISDKSLPSHGISFKSITPNKKSYVTTAPPESIKHKPTKAVNVKPLPSTPSVESSGKFPDECLQWHNHYRAKHGVPLLKLSTELCSYAQVWANHLAKTDSFQHRTDRKYGENIYMSWSSNPTAQISGKIPVDSWYSEIKDYTFGKEPLSLSSGHFTQVVWRSSTELGVAQARSKTNKIIVVANYNPAGNMVGSFAANVPSPK
ncbi:Golgi-associated plant pathogenesis-related protein 1-like [Tachypleus tridentatus]|uniref:Golgi-associated plant pathogenesis-related protein 1-like n=1 Tax=Tachypleus tridentatus TaxID=6853 RepID=UPI003FD0FBEF